MCHECEEWLDIQSGDYKHKWVCKHCDASSQDYESIKHAHLTSGEPCPRHSYMIFRNPYRCEDGSLNRKKLDKLHSSIDLFWCFISIMVVTILFGLF